ncbi:MAG: hypothetical protein KAT65_07680, partial [Methanophagales archaeon]|nr:hypothetical protein [Methanophagales archaeon]
LSRQCKMKSAKCKSQSTTDSNNECFKVKRALFHPYRIFCIFQFSLSILQSIARKSSEKCHVKKKDTKPVNKS